MKAIAIRPGTPDSVHLRDLPRPSIEEIADGRGHIKTTVEIAPGA